MSLLCMTVWLVLSLIPLAMAVRFSGARRPGVPAIGATLMILSFFVLPWLNLQPLKYVGLDWLFDIAPAAEWLARLLGAGVMGGLFGGIGFIDPIFNPPGWATLALVAGPLTWLAVLGLGASAYWLAVLVIWRNNSARLGQALSLVSVTLSLFLFYRLPDIDGLGERTFPSLTALIVPLTGAKLSWIGPLGMFVSLGLLIWAGLRMQFQGTGSDWEEPQA